LPFSCGKIGIGPIRRWSDGLRVWQKRKAAKRKDDKEWWGCILEPARWIHRFPFTSPPHVNFVGSPKEAKDEAGREILRLIQIRLATLSLKKPRYSVKLNCYGLLTTFGKPAAQTVLDNQ
jgi:hypothetical protein